MSNSYSSIGRMMTTLLLVLCMFLPCVLLGGCASKTGETFVLNARTAVESMATGTDTANLHTCIDEAIDDTFESDFTGKSTPSVSISSEKIFSIIEAIQGEEFVALCDECCKGKDLNALLAEWASFDNGYEGTHSEYISDEVAESFLAIEEAVAGVIDAKAAEKFMEAVDTGTSTDELLTAIETESLTISPQIKSQLEGLDDTAKAALITNHPSLASDLPAVSRDVLVKYLTENGDAVTTTKGDGFYADDADGYGDFKTTTTTTEVHVPAKDNGTYKTIRNNDGSTSRVYVPNYVAAHTETRTTTSHYFKDHAISFAPSADSSSTFVYCGGTLYEVKLASSDGSYTVRVHGIESDVASTTIEIETTAQQAEQN